MKKFLKHNKFLILSFVLFWIILTLLVLTVPVAFSSFKKVDVLSEFWVLITMTGNITGLLIILSSFAIFIGILYKKKFGKVKIFFNFYLVFFLALAVLGVLNSYILKEVFKELRPSEKILQQELDITQSEYNLADVNEKILREWKEINSYTFPSGHSVGSFFIAVIFAYILFNILAEPLKLFFLIAPLWAFLVSISRVVIGIHYPIDVIVGSMIGITAGVVFLYISKVFTIFNPVIDATFDQADKS